MKFETIKKSVMCLALAASLVVGSVPTDGIFISEVHAADRAVQVLNITNGSIVINNSGYTYNGATIAFSGDYTITGSSKDANTVIVDGYTGTLTFSGVTIDNSTTAPVIIQGNSNVNIVINDTCIFRNSGSNNNKPVTWPGFAIGSGNNTVTFTGGGTISATGGKYNPGIGGVCSDEFTENRRSYSFNSTVTFNGPTVSAIGGSGGAPAIGTGRACNVTGGEFVFANGRITAKGNSVGATAIGLCETNSLSEAVNIPVGSFESKLTLRFTGAGVTANAGSYAAAIGAGRGTSAYKVYITGGSVTATGGSESPAIGGGGKTTSIDLFEMTDGVLEATAGSSAPAIGDGTGVTTPDSVISIKGGTLTATSNVTNSSPIRGNASISDYKDLNLQLSYNVDGSQSIQIPYDEHTQENYITTCFSQPTGTYYKTLVTSATTAYRGATCKWVKFQVCTAHTYDYTPDTSDENTHTLICKYCHHQSPNSAHVWKYTAEGQTITEKCEDCGLEHTFAIEDSTEPYDKEEHLVRIITNTIAGKPTIEYAGDDGVYSSSAPKSAGTYTARVSIGDATITAVVIIDAVGMDITSNNVTHEFDGTGYNIGVTVHTPADAMIEFSTDGVNYSSEIPKFSTVGRHMCYYRVTRDSYTPVVGVRYVIITPKAIDGITITGVDVPTGGLDLDTSAICDTTGIADRTPIINWTDSADQEVSGTAAWNASYNGYVVLYPDTTGYAISASITSDNVTVNGVASKSCTYNPDGSITVHFVYTTDKAELTSIMAPSKISGLPHGVPKSAEGLQLPETVKVTCEDPSVTELPVKWALSLTIGVNYDPAVEIEQNFQVSGTVTVPDYINVPSEISTSVSAPVQVLADTVEEVGADPEPGVYNETTTLHLATDRAGADIYYTLDGGTPTTSSTLYDANTGIVLAGTEGVKKDYTIKAFATKTGLYSSVVKTFNYTINMADMTPPTAEIHIDANNWSTFWNKVTFGLFNTSARTVTIDYDDEGSGLAAQYYYVSEEELSSQELNELADWVTYTDAFTIGDIGKYIVYAKAVDNEGNVTYVNSSGLVIYKNAARNTLKVNAIPHVDQSVDFYVTLNGNTVKSLSIESIKLDESMYEVNERNGMITLDHTAFDDLSYGDYTMSVAYNPQGEIFVASADNDMPEETTVNLTIVKPKLLSVTQPSPVTDIPNGTALEGLANYLPSQAFITTEDPTVNTAPIVWDLTKTLSGTYDPTYLGDSSFTMQGVVQLDSGILRNNISLNVTVSVSVLAAGTLTKPVATVKSGRYVGSVTVGLTSADGADIYYTLDGSLPDVATATKYTAPITLTTSAAIKAICHKDGMFDSGLMSESYIITDGDATAPTGTIAIGNESLWSSLWSGALWQFFTKKTQTITITGEDPESGIKAIFYYLSPKELTADELEEVTAWEQYVEPLHLESTTGGFVYAKIINNDDLYSYINSNGVVVYKDAEAITDSVTYVKATNNDVEFSVKLNGNTIKAIRNGGTTLNKSYYSQSSNGTVVLSAVYLESLSTGNYTFYIDYYPYGVDNSNATGKSEAPTSTSLKVLISAKSTGQNTGTGSNTGGMISGGVANSGTVTPTNPNFEETGTGTTTVTNKDGVKHTVETVTYTDKSKLITDTSTDKSGTTTVTATHKNKSGATTTVSSTVTTKDGTVTDTVTEYVSSDQTKTTTTKTDKKGNSYQRVYVVNKDGSYTEKIVSNVSDTKTTDNFKLSTSGKITQTYKSDKIINGDIVTITIKGSGSQYSPKYVETYTWDVSDLDKCVVKVTRTNSKVSATAGIIQTNDAGNQIVIEREFLDYLDEIATINDASGTVTEVSTIHKFSTGRKSVNGVDVTYKLNNSVGKKRYTVKFNTNDIVGGTKLRQFKFANNKYIMCGTKSTALPDSGDLHMNPSRTATYVLAGSKTYKAINKGIAVSAKFNSSATLSLKVGGTSKLKYSSKFDTSNIKSVSYKSSNSKVATVSSSGTVTANRKGSATITATLKFVNGGTKKLTRKVTCK